MTRAYPLTRRLGWRFRLLATALAVIGQLAIVSASLTLAREESSAVSHTEQSGTNLHHGHNEATCPSCAALSFQTALGDAYAVVDAGAIRHLITSNLALDRADRPQLRPNSCRAPPREA